MFSRRVRRGGTVIGYPVVGVPQYDVKPVHLPQPSVLGEHYTADPLSDLTFPGFFQSLFELAALVFRNQIDGLFSQQLFG
jgi:hypothetical protein